MTSVEILLAWLLIAALFLTAIRVQGMAWWTRPAQTRWGMNLRWALKATIYLGLIRLISELIRIMTS